MNIDAKLTNFNKIFTNYRERFIRFSFSYVRDLAVAEDITADSFMSYWENRDSLPEDTNIPAYIITSIKNKSINYLEHLRVREEYSEKTKANREWELGLRISSLEACEPKELFAGEVQVLIDKTLDSLPEQTRSVFISSRFDEKTYQEIASDLSISIKGVEYHISRALKSLRKALKEYI